MLVSGLLGRRRLTFQPHTCRVGLRPVYLRMLAFTVAVRQKHEDEFQSGAEDNGKRTYGIASVRSPHIYAAKPSS
jgi:hypothetical protein